MNNTLSMLSGARSFSVIFVGLGLMQLGCPPSNPISPSQLPPTIPSACSGDPCASVDCPNLDGVPCEATLPPEEPGQLQPMRGFICDDAFEGTVLSSVEGTGGAQVLTRKSSRESCTYDLIYKEPTGEEKTLSTVSSGFLSAMAAVAPSSDTLVCASHMQHRKTEEDELRFVERVMIDCWVKVPSGTWLGPKAVVAPDGPWAAWIIVLGAKSDGRREYSVRYNRDFTFSPLNLVNEGRPESDGVYKAHFSVENDRLVRGSTERLSGPNYPTVEDFDGNMNDWIPSQEEKERLRDLIDFGDGDCPPPLGCKVVDDE